MRRSASIRLSTSRRAGWRTNFRDDRKCEFARIDDRRIGQPHDWFIIAALSGRTSCDVEAYDVLCKVDGATGKIEERQLDGKAIEESIFAPRDGQPGGYVLTYLYDATADITDLLILDIDDIAGDPVAIVHLPVRVPVRLHGSWLPGEPMP